MIFILGGRGLLGSAFARACAASGLQHTILDRANYDQFTGQACDLFINANGNSRKPLAREKPLEEFDASVRSVRRTLIDFRFHRYLHLSSCDVYPDCSSPALTTEDLPLNPALQSPYGFHKRLAEMCVQHAAPHWLIFRLGGFVGPGLKKNAIFDILNGGPLWLDPQSRLQFLHTNDAARLMLDIASQGVSGEIINLCGAGTIALDEVLAATGKQVPVQPASPRVHYEVSIAKAAQWARIPDTRSTVLDFVRAHTQ